MRKLWIALLWLGLCAPGWTQVVPSPKHMLQGSWPDPQSLEARGMQRLRCAEPQFEAQLSVLAEALGRLGVDGITRVEERADLIFERGEVGAGNTYSIRAEGSALVVTAAQPVGAAHAVTTLLQLVSVDEGRASWPALDVRDGPDLGYRSFMVDMGRNPHSPETLRRVVDFMAYYKANYLHLHLADDQLCSWPSEAYPELYSERAGWSRAEFVALEAYSQARGVTVLPELDVPGHSTILRRAYPEVFGAEPTDLATSPAAQEGVETLLAEMMSVFESSPYVHIGGDEAYGVPEELQRDFINRLNAFVKAHGKRTVVWEGPRLGEGDDKVDEDVLHLNWRTINVSAQAMLDAGYEVVNAAWDPLYIVDHYPRTMFTAVDVERCYGWDARRFAHVNHDFPTFAEPHRTRTSEGILGFCMPWWEGREENLIPLCLPRLAAVASAAWNRAGEHDFDDFMARQARALQRLKALTGIELPAMPVAAAAAQADNLAFLGTVRPSSAASQPHFGPQRLTNGLVERFDHFLGYPTQPEPLEIVIELRRPAVLGRIAIFETAVNGSHELYELFVSADGERYEQVGYAKQGTRGEHNFVEHVFEAREVGFIKILTEGCHGLTFPSFSRLCEVLAFAQ